MDGSTTDGWTMDGQTDDERTHGRQMDGQMHDSWILAAGSHTDGRMDRRSDDAQTNGRTDEWTTNRCRRDDELPVEIFGTEFFQH